MLSLVVPDFNTRVDYRRVLKTVEQREERREQREGGVGREKGKQREKKRSRERRESGGEKREQGERERGDYNIVYTAENGLV